ncbi:uncharacterized protein LOC134553800 [Prinia subflava]|uniref:uncharacterized protein LOC134553800 n=1 Tax=Prinia subflava TaxID=208062 RepID=UPI002FE1FA00
MAGRTVWVQGFPAELPPERAADKLTIHFQRTRNGGGDVAEVRVLPGSPPCALITFEVPEVAQRILNVKNHVLAIGRTRYPLEVILHPAELSPDEIFIAACMTIDYSRLPMGKTLLRDLQKNSNVQLSFDSKNMHCIVQGPFTQLQILSQDLLDSLQLKNQSVGEIFRPGSRCSSEEMGMQEHQQVLDFIQSAQETAKLPNGDQVHETAAKVPSPQSPVRGEAVEDFSLPMDLDIYLYMQKVCAAEYQGVLRQHHVEVVDVMANGTAILYLRPAGGGTGNRNALRQAHLALQQLHQQLKASLHKEKIAKERLGMDSQELTALTCELQQLCPQLLCHEDGKNLYLLGKPIDVSQAKQFLQDSVTRRSAARTVSPLSSSQPSGTTEAALPLPKEPVGTPARRLSPSRLEVKGEFKLAANFSTLKGDGSQAGQGLLLNQDSPLEGQLQLSGQHSLETDAPALSALSQQHRPHTPMTDKVLGSAAEPQQNRPTERDHVEGGARRTGQKVLLPCAGKESSTFQRPEDSKGSDPTGHHPLTASSSISDGTLLSASKLQQSNISLQAAEENNSKLREDMTLDFLQWFYLKAIYPDTISELCKNEGLYVLECDGGNRTLLMLQATDSKRLSQAKLKVENLVQMCPDLVCGNMSYSDLNVPGPDDSDLNELCSLLQGKSFQVCFRKHKDKLFYVCPRDVLPGVYEAFQMFSSRRLSAMKSLSMSAASESPGKSSIMQPSRSQDAVLDAALSGSPNSLQPGNISNQVHSKHVSRASCMPEAEKKRGSSPLRFQQAWGQEKAGDHIDSVSGRGGSSFLGLGAGDKPSSPGLRESQEPRKTKLFLGEPDTTRVKQVLPDRFQLAGDKSRGGHHKAMGQQHSPVPAADGAPHSLSPRLARATAAEPPPTVVQQAPAAEPTNQGRAQLPRGRTIEQEEPELPSQQRRDPSLGQKSTTILPCPCHVCHCGNVSSRTRFAADRPSSAVPSCKIRGTVKVCSLSQSLPGYPQTETLQVVYSIPDGVQGVGDPRPGQPYKGGVFCAFLPNNEEGMKTAELMREAFERGLTFQIKSCNGEERVTWGFIPHKTSCDGGKARNGYPDDEYLSEVSTVLNQLNLM